MAARPLAVVVGSIGKLPLGGHTVFVSHHLVGLQELGYDVHYVERLASPDEAYDPRTNEMTDDPSYALDYLRTTLPRSGVDNGSWTFVDLDGTFHGADRDALERAVGRADFVLNVTDPVWLDELGGCARRAYIDGDPMFTQVAMETGAGARGHAPAHYPVLFTYGVRTGCKDCTIPTGARAWLPARPVVATSLWRLTPPPSRAPITALLHWRAGGEVIWQGRSYGHKDRQFMRFAELPRRAPGWQFVVAAGGGRVPHGELEAAGWELDSPLDHSRSPARYCSFVYGSAADLGVAKDAYVASRGGWFSDRSTSFLAAGRPVLHQDTGFTEWLPAGEGVLPFSDLDELVERVRELEADYDRHARAARAIAEEHFEARTVLAGMLEAAGFR
jgi:hypothetical protein